MRLHILTILGTIVAAQSCAQSPAPVQTAIRNLGHDRYAVRQNAQKQLEEIGEPALKALRESLSSNDEEVRVRAEKLIAMIEGRILNEKLLVAPKLSFKFENTPLESAMAEVSRKSGLSLHFAPGEVANPKRPISLDTGELAYWEAIQAFLKAARLREAGPLVKNTGLESVGKSVRQGQVPSSIPPNDLLLKDGAATDVVFSTKAIRVRAFPIDHPVYRVRDIPGTLTIPLDIDPLPGLNCVGIVGVEIRSAKVDSQVFSSAYPDPFVKPPNGYLSDHGLILGEGLPRGVVTVSLKTESLRLSKIDELSGIVVARVQTPPETLFTLSKLNDSQSARTGRHEGIHCQILDLEPFGQNSYSLQLTMVFESNLDALTIPLNVDGQPRPFSTIRKDGLLFEGPEIKLIDGMDREIRLHGSTLVLDDNGTSSIAKITVSFETPEPLNKLKLQVIGSRSVTLQMPFTLKNVPLP